MKKLFKHISSQPKAKRDSYAFMVAGTFTGMVALVWAFSLPEKMDTIGSANEADSPAPFANLIKETGEQLASVKNSLKPVENLEANVEEASSSDSIMLSEDEILEAREALANNSASSSEVSTTTIPVPVLIGTTTATTSSYSASSTP